MPLRLTPDEQDILRELSTPIDKGRQPEFVEAVLEAAGPAGGPGALHRAAREVLEQFWTAPPDLRQNRIGPRGPRG
jgi:hypothetical protein